MEGNPVFIQRIKNQLASLLDTAKPPGFLHPGDVGISATPNVPTQSQFYDRRNYTHNENGDSIGPELLSSDFSTEDWPLEVQIKQEQRDASDDALIVSCGSGSVDQEEMEPNPIEMLCEVKDDRSSCSFEANSPAKKRGKRPTKRVRGSHQCGKCEMSFSTVKEHCLHLKFHRGETKYAEPYACSVCGFVATSDEGHKAHRRIHTGEKPYRCDTCGTSFRLRSTRYRHSLTHLPKTKPRECGTCGRGFTQLAALVSHRKSGGCSRQTSRLPPVRQVFRHRT